MTKMASIQWLAVFGVSILIFTIPSKAEETGDSYAYKVVVENHDTEDDVTILDKDGNVVNTVIVQQDEGYEVEKPTDSDVCLLKMLEDDSTCFEDLPVKEGLPEGVRSFCKGKEIRILNPITCENTDDSDVASRVKRSTSTFCTWKSYSCTKLCGSYCCKRNFWGKCKKECSRYCSDTCWTKTCISDSSNPTFSI